MTDIVTIAGSPSVASRSGALLSYVRQTVERAGLSTATITVRDLPPEDLVYGRYDSPAIAAQASLIEQARAVVIATPIYKAAYSGVLKSFLDLLPTRILDGKLVLPIATGGSPLHALALDYALLPVLSALGTQHTLNSIYIVDSQLQITADKLQLDPIVADRLDGTLQILVEALGISDAVIR